MKRARYSKEAATLLACAGLFVGATNAFASDAEFEKRVADIHARAITIDTHVDIPALFATPVFDPTKVNDVPVQVDLPRMKLGGLDAAFFIVYVPQRPRTAAHYAAASELALAKFSAIHRMVEREGNEDIVLALTAADVRRIVGEGKSVALIGIENGFSIGKNIELLDVYYRFGARYFGLVHNGHNDLADSAQLNLRFGDEAEEHGGISALGKQAIRRCNDLGIMVDVSHASRPATLQAAALSDAPIIASHSAVQGKFDHPRNISDEEMMAVAEGGGVIQVVAFDSYLRELAPEKKDGFKKVRERFAFNSLNEYYTANETTRRAYADDISELHKRWGRASVSDLVDHIDHAVSVVGIDHVGIASDFQGGGGVNGWDAADETPNVTRELLKRGYSEEDVVRLWGGNLLRVMESVESVAERRRQFGFFRRVFGD